MRVVYARSIGFLHIFAAGVLIMRYSWWSFVVVTLTSSFGLIYDKIWFLQHSSLVVMVCKHALLGVFPQPMFFQWLLDLIVSNE
jgi:hypothetical protein